MPCAPVFLSQLEQHILLFYTDRRRDADSILKKQSEGSADKMSVLRQMRDLAGELRTTMGGQGNLEDFGRILHEGWELKRSLGFGISNAGVDEWYQAARANGAMGGKLLGAGGGGFLLVMAPPDRHERIRAALGRPREIPFRIDRRGSRVIFISDRYAF